MVRKKGSDLKGLRGEAMPYIEIEEYDREHVEIGRWVSEGGRKINSSSLFWFAQMYKCVWGMHMIHAY